MPNTLSNSLEACIRGIDQMILPAIDQNNPLAREQAQLIAKTLRFTIERLPWLSARSRQEMKLYAHMSREVLSDTADVLPALVSVLEAEVRRAEQLWQDPHAHLCEMDDCAAAMASALAELVRGCRDDTTPAARRIERTVLKLSPEINHLNRAWHVLSGFETRPEEIRPLTSFFPARPKAIQKEDRL